MVFQHDISASKIAKNVKKCKLDRNFNAQGISTFKIATFIISKTHGFNDRSSFL